MGDKNPSPALPGLGFLLLAGRVGEPQSLRWMPLKSGDDGTTAMDAES